MSRECESLSLVEREKGRERELFSTRVCTIQHNGYLKYHSQPWILDPNWTCNALDDSTILGFLISILPEFRTITMSRRVNASVNRFMRVSAIV